MGHVSKQDLHIAAGQIQRWVQALPSVVSKLLQGALLFIYPPTCAGCAQILESEEPTPFCPDCFKALDLILEPYCPLCGIPYQAEAPSRHLCGDCLGGVHHFDRALARGLYQGLLREVIHRFKYRGQLFLARPLAKMLAAPAKELTSTQDQLHCPGSSPFQTSDF